MSGGLATRKISRLRSAGSTGRERYRHADHPSCFEIYRADQVSLTSTLFSGGDWRWRLRSAAGTILVNSEGYSSERACRAAVAALRANAGWANVAEQTPC